MPYGRVPWGRTMSRRQATAGGTSHPARERRDFQTSTCHVVSPRGWCDSSSSLSAALSAASLSAKPPLPALPQLPSVLSSPPSSLAAAPPDGAGRRSAASSIGARGRYAAAGACGAPHPSVAVSPSSESSSSDHLRDGCCQSKVSGFMADARASHVSDSRYISPRAQAPSREPLLQLEGSPLLRGI